MIALSFFVKRRISKPKTERVETKKMHRVRLVLSLRFGSLRDPSVTKL